MLDHKVVVGALVTAAISISGVVGGVIWANHNRSTENATKHVDEVTRSKGVDDRQHSDITHNHDKLENHAERISALEAIIKGR